MKELGKVNSKLLYKIWRNLSLCLVGELGIIALTILLPYYLSPVWGLLCAAVLYNFIYDKKGRKDATCLLIPFAFLYIFVGYAFVAILINILYSWGMDGIPNELVFFSNPPYLPTLILFPISFAVMLFVKVRHRHLQVCRDCRKTNGDLFERGNQGRILDHETNLQMSNLTFVFGVLALAVWLYYELAYVNVNLNNRDWYVFGISAMIVLGLEIAYFSLRYYNLYLDLEENDELISQNELSHIGSKTYLRYYVICGEKLYVDPTTIDPQAPWKEVVDTPFFTKRSVNGININEVRKTIRQMTGQPGELRFFYGRKVGDETNNSILRYFYFLDCDGKDCPRLTTDGEWMDFDKIKYIYRNNPGRLGEIAVKDITRLATIMLTSKIFNEKGYRKSRIKLYNPTFDMADVRKSNLDFQDDKWIEISMFNSDTPFYGIKRNLRRWFGEKKKSNRSQWS